MIKKQVEIEQYISGNWVTLISVPLEDDATLESAVETISVLTEKLHKSGSLFMTLKDGYSIIITAANGPLKLELR